MKKNKILETIAINKNGNRALINKTDYNEKEMDLWEVEKKEVVKEVKKIEVKVDEKPKDEIKPKKKIKR